MTECRHRTGPIGFALLLAAAAALPCAALTGAGPARAADKPPETKFKAETFNGLELRGIGPAVTSGRVVDIAVHPAHKNVWYVAVASGGVWKTTNSGATWTPIFDAQGSYSIGCVTIDPHNPLVIWVGTGENNSQRSVGFGDGVYRSSDGGTSWENVGLKKSEHIGRILVDPRDSSIVYVAAQGPLWAPGGDRGLFKSVNGGRTWNAVLTVSENTGVTDVAYDPRNPDVLYAASYQRRRHVWTLIDGGPESAIYKSTDGGASWKKLENGLPKEEMGRIALAVAPSSPDTVYAMIESINKAGGVYRSTDMGGNWEKMSDFNPNGPMYYQELFPDPLNAARVYATDTYLKVTEDAGKTFVKVPEKTKHVDNHVVWIDPSDTDHLLVGCDGGLYETWDRGATWDFKADLPVTQFYRVALDNALPFYRVYGGTQDNNTLGGPSRTTTAHGIVNSDWYVTQGGDGFHSQVDPEEPDIVYSEAQHGGLVRFDRRNGETVDIQPQPDPTDDPSRWNWDSPLLISPHAHTRLYFAAQRLYRSDDRGNSWRAVSPDLTRQIDRNRLKVMGRVWSVDAIAKNQSTSFYGNIVSLAESPLKEGLLYVGTDDGLVQVSPDGGATWRKVESFPGVPEHSYVSRLTASQHAPDTVYAAFGNHKMGDFKPYILKSTDQGRSWTSIASDLPERGPVWALAEDSKDARLLFAGTEFGLFFTTDGGGKWVQLKGKMPIIPVRDIALQKRENDLVLASFGRGFFVLDDYSPLRGLDAAALDKEALFFPVKDAWMFAPSQPLGLKDKAFQGDEFYSAPNPPFGAIFTYYLKDEILTRQKTRQKAEKETIKKGGDVFYPPWETLQAEEREDDPVVIFTVSDEDGHVVRRLTGPVTAGFHRVAWDLRFPVSKPAQLKPGEEDQFAPPREGPLAAPGTYSVTMAKRVAGTTTQLAGPITFKTVPLSTATLPAPDREAVLAFARKTARLQRAVTGAVEAAGEAQNRVNYLKVALLDTPGADPRLMEELTAIDKRLKDLLVPLTGDKTRAKHNEPAAPSISDRVEQIVGGSWFNTQAPTATHRHQYDVAAEQFGGVLDKLRVLVEQDLKGLEDKAELAGAPWTPGRLPRWRAE